MKKAILILFLLSLTGCLGYPESIKPISGFNLNSYLGTWYEIARLDHSFERGLSKVTAEYSLKEDGGVKVVNRGFSSEEGKWKEAIGKAYFVAGTDTGYLKVSFFGPFYGSYVVFNLDTSNYQYAFVTGPDYSYLWLLSRTPEIDDGLQSLFIEQIKDLGFDSNKLIWVNHR